MKKNGFSKFTKALSIFCAMSLFTTSVCAAYEIVASAEVNTYSAVTYDFDDTAVTGEVGGIHVASRDQQADGSSGQFTIAEVDGNKALKITHSVKNTSWQVGAFLLNDGTNIATLVPDKTYTLSFRYRIDNVTESVYGTTAWFYATQSPKLSDTSEGTWGYLQAQYNAIDGSEHSAAANRILSSFNKNNISSLSDLNGTPVLLKKWNTFSYTFKAKDLGYNYFGFAVCTVTGLEMYIDDVTLAEGCKSIAFDSNRGTPVPTIYGSNSDPIDLPAEPVLEGFKFDGWYTDIELKTKFTATSFDELESSEILYAKWIPNDVFGDVEVFDFEDESTTVTTGNIGGVPVTSFDNSSNMNTFRITVEESGNKVLEISHPSNYGLHYKNSSFILNKNNKMQQLIPGHQYNVSMRVKINSLNTQANARVALAEDFFVGDAVPQNLKNEFGALLGDSSAFADKYTPDSRKTIDKLLIRDISNGNVPVYDVNNDEIPIGEWHTISKSFFAYDNMTNGNLYVGFTICTGTGLSIYIDDIVFTDISGKKTVVFNTNFSDVTIPSEFVSPGEELTLPVPERNGFIFDGWYKDSALQEKVDNTIIVSEDMILYAKWHRSSGIITVDFETGYDDSVTNVQGVPAFGTMFYINKSGANNHGDGQFVYNAEECKSGAASLLIDASKSETDNSSALLRSSGFENGIIAYPGERYKIDFSYKVSSGDATGARLMIGYSDYVSSLWYKVNQFADGSAYFANDSAENGWRNATIVYKNDTGSNQYMHLMIDLAEAKNKDVKIYIDDITLEPLGQDTVIVSTVDNLNKERLYLFGKSGDSLNITIPETAGRCFKGWFIDPENETLFNNETYPDNDVELFAGWTEIGDVNADGFIDIRDLVRLKKYISYIEYKPEADVTANGSLGSDDLAAVCKYLLSL